MVEFCRTLDDDTFRELAERHYATAIRIADSILNNYAAAEDAVQEALVRIVRYRGKYDPSKPFKPWLQAIVRNTCIDMVRKRARYEELLEEYAEPGSSCMARVNTAERVHAVMAGLSHEDAHLLNLRYFAGMSFHEIAGRLGVSLDAAKKRCQRLLARLRN